MEPIQNLLWFVLHILAIPAGLVLIVEGSGEAVNFMGDHKTSVGEKMFGVFLLLCGAWIVGWGIGIQ